MVGWARYGVAPHNAEGNERHVTGRRPVVLQMCRSTVGWGLGHSARGIQLKSSMPRLGNPGGGAVVNGVTR